MDESHSIINDRLEGCYFLTYVSASWNKKVSTQFVGKHGMLKFAMKLHVVQLIGFQNFQINTRY